MIVSSMASGFLLAKWGYRKPMLMSSIVISIGLFLFAFEFSQVKIFGLELSPVIMVSTIALLMGLGMGAATTSSSTSCLDLMPNRTSTITGVRGMFRQTGGAISIAVATMILQLLGNMSIGFTAVFVATGAIVLLTIPFVFALPDKDNLKIKER